jgi:F-type H+-transporting ATPase subunit b
MSTASNFLVPDATIGIELIAFGIVLAVVTKFVLPRLRAAVAHRQEQVAASLAGAADADRRARSAEQHRREVLAAARREAREVTEQAYATRDYLIAEGRREGREEYVWLAGRAARESARHDELVASAAAANGIETVTVVP